MSISFNPAVKASSLKFGAKDRHYADTLKDKPEIPSYAQPISSHQKSGPSRMTWEQFQKLSTAHGSKSIVVPHDTHGIRSATITREVKNPTSAGIKLLDLAKKD
ncbi:MAG: hypothetical protein VKJ06_07250 [Vampirovibrionales bacterium]|nr:hypothetical protein [Vampirovibrionales bacterium]